MLPARRLTIVLSACAAALLAAWLVLGAKRDGAPAKTSAAPAAGIAARPAVAGTGPSTETAIATGAVAAAPVPTGTIPPGVTADQWAALQAEMARRPDGGAELARLAAYFGWSDAVRRWRAAPADPALAAEVRDGLAARFANREVSAAEARQIEAATLAVLEPDEARRAAMLQAYDAALPRPSGPDARELAFQRDQAAAVAAWRRAPAAARDPAALTAELDRLRRLHFAQATPHAPQETSR